MKNTRHNVFETNSSSTHSISVNENADGIYSTIPVHNGVIKLTGGRFGWDWERFNDPLTKANYAVLDTSDITNLSMLVEVIKEHTGAKEVVINAKGYIDHQSVGTVSSSDIWTSKSRLKEWLFSPNSFLFTGNDNSVAPPNFFDSPDTIYTHELIISGIKGSYKFKSIPEISDTNTELVEAFDSLLDNCEYHLYEYDDKECKIVNSFANVTKGYVTGYKDAWSSDTTKVKKYNFTVKEISK